MVGSFCLSLYLFFTLFLSACSRQLESFPLAHLQPQTASEALQDESEVGLLPFDASTLPPEVKTAANSVFRIVIHWDTAFPYEKLDYAKASAHLQSYCSGESKDFIHTKNCEAVRKCFANLSPDSPEFCHVPYLTGGTAWIAGKKDGRTVLLTNWHVLERQFAPQLFLAVAIASRPAVERKQLLRHLVPIFSLFNAKGELAYDSTTNPSAPPSLVDLGDILGASFSSPEIKGIASLIEDYVAIEIPTDLGHALKVASQTPSAEDRAYAVGYPIRTSGRNVVSDGHQLYVSPGRFHSREQFMHLVTPLIKPADKSNSEPEPDQLRLAKDYALPTRGFVYSNCDVVGGNSGGPLLNGRGQVVGMVARAYSNEFRYEPAGGVALFVPNLPVY